MTFKFNLLLLIMLVLLSACKQDKTEKTSETDDSPHLTGGHSHVHTPHLGVMAPIRNGDEETAYVELKLHDDKGDLELWITEDKKGTVAIDLPLDTVIKVTFPKLEKSVELRVRNTDKNEDEDGKANIREGKTNYFIFPGESGADASFLKGKTFSSEASLSYDLDGKSYTTEVFILEPHVH